MTLRTRLLLVVTGVAVALTATRCSKSSPTGPSGQPEPQVTVSVTPMPMRAEPERLGSATNRYHLDGDATFRSASGVGGRITQLTFVILCADGRSETQKVATNLTLPSGGSVAYHIAQTIDAPSANPPAKLELSATGVDQGGAALTIHAIEVQVVSGSPTTTGPFNHVFVVVEENRRGEDVIGNPQMPYLNSLASQYGMATEYYANTHPSIGNYFMLTVGRIVSNSDDYSSPVNEDNIVRRLLAAGLTWKSYAEDLPLVGYTGGNVGLYVRRHNVIALFDDVVNSPTQVKNLVPFTHFAIDLAENTLPNYAFIVPNLCNNGHDCPAATVDQWLQANIAPLVGSSQFQRDGLLIVTYDEAADSDVRQGGGRIAWVAVSGKSKRGYRSSTLYQHQSTLRLTAQALGLTIFPNLAATAPDMREFFLF